MNTLEVTDEQYAFIQRLREEISTDVVGKYGFVRERDAVQFLIDNLSEDVDIDDEVDFSATDDVAASVDAAIEGEDDPHELETVSYDERTAAGAGTDSTTDSESAGPSENETSDAENVEEVEDEGETQDDDDDSIGSTSGAADDDDMLDEMMSLLETHDDKWEESSSADYRYTVTLPDGSTEDVQTKDDVRALLFKNYR
ncbi:hypothetical protein [Natrarchaeobaculum sulfurireducens]|uniref:Uncharacterized protein n=1 Tax=Natrarchaeobaculum sulfurireducens TaxID=2044521 RepID=A0A346PF64_9EURY|nr:hypothetical protein [Natrarchaeobaculum sulfurireducens]AXR78159.1 hypothetical protein AArc1_1836 [Natrarchaeobaculum sulfurireducens]